MRRHICKLPFLVAAAVAMNAISAGVSQAFYNCHTGSTRSAQGSGTTLVSSTFVNLPGANVPILVDASSPCVRIDFSAQIRAMHPKGIKVRVVVVGTTVTGFPHVTEFYTSENRFDGRMVSFVIPNWPFNSTAIKMQVLSLDGTQVTIGTWTVSVHHAGAYG